VAETEYVHKRQRRGPEPGTRVRGDAGLLFADPREAESSCGCGQIIRMVRGANVPGIVAVQEFDPQRESEAARVHAVRVNPTVIIARRDGVEQVRFEGESPDVIAGLRGALAALTSGTAQPTDEGSP
jgi:hypothetical protein